MYKIPCECGQDYIGETKRTLAAHLMEHQTATRRGETETSAIVAHAWMHPYCPLWDEISIVDQARNMQQRVAVQRSIPHSFVRTGG